MKHQSQFYACLIFLTLSSIILFSGSNFPDADIYYHIGIAKYYITNGLVDKLPWPTIGIQSTAYTDYHFLFHLIQIPFLLLPIPEVYSIKIFSILCIAWSFYQFLRLFDNSILSPIFLGTLFFLGSILFTGRFFFLRGNILFLGFFFLTVNYYLKSNKPYIFLFSFLSVWAYSGFLIIPFTLTLFTVFSWKDISKIKLVAISYAGIMSGLLVHPSFPNQLNGYFLELIVQFFPPNDLEPIAEWLPPSKEILMLGFFPTIILFSYTLYRLRSFDYESKTYLLGFILSLVLAGASLRVFEFSYIFFLLFISKNLTLKFSNQIKIVLITSIFQIPLLFSKMSDQFLSTNPDDFFKVANWIKKNMEKETKIFLSWADYPFAVFKIPEKQFLFGLNPVYAWAKNPEIYQLQRSFFEAKIEGFESIPGLLGYKFIVINRIYYEPTYQLLKGNFENFDLKYSNDRYGIFEIKISENAPQKEKIKPK